jgi:hypothetical protein
MGIAQADRLLKRLRQKGAESANVEAKEVVNLNAPGDKATFLRHVAALANTGRRAHLLIGVEDKTWALKGLPEGSPLRDADQTQQQMNQIIAKRLDPPLDVDYWTCHVEGAVVGVVQVNGRRPPYIIAIDNDRYGGERASGAQSYVHKGDIYLRRSANSVIANRQGEILALLQGRRDVLGAISELLLVVVAVGAGAGVLASVVRFASPGVGGLLGLAWGIVVGLVLRRRVADAVRAFFGSPPLRDIAANLVSLVCGALLGWVTAYRLVQIVLRGDVSPLHPIAMSLVVGPFGAALTALPYALLALSLWYAVKSIREAVDLWAQRRS